jgi:hypothetical protein
MNSEQPNLDPPIKVGDIVYVDVADVYHSRGGEEWNFVAMIKRITPAEGVDLDACGGNMKSVALERCFHATEKQKAEYFKLVLQFGN